MTGVQPSARFRLVGWHLDAGHDVRLGLLRHIRLEHAPLLLHAAAHADGKRDQVRCGIGIIFTFTAEVNLTQFLKNIAGSEKRVDSLKICPSLRTNTSREHRLLPTRLSALPESRIQTPKSENAGP